MWRAVLGVFAVGMCFVACGSGSDSGGRGGAAGADAGGGSSGSDGSAGTAGVGGMAGADADGGCQQFGYVASGEPCPTSGCPSFGCGCPGAFPISLTSCSPDGCLIAADCDVLCAKGLDQGFQCTDTYTVAAGGSGGVGGGGSGGSGGAAPTCSAGDIKIPAASAELLGNAPLTNGRLLPDGSGGVFVAGTVPASAPVDYGNGQLPAGTRVILLHLDANGMPIWTRRFGSSLGFESVARFQYAKNGDLLIAGVTAAQTDLGGGPETLATVPQLYVARYATDGTFKQSYLLPTSNTLPELVAITENTSGDLLMWGDFYATFTVGSTVLDAAGSTSDKDIFMVRFSSTGAIQEAKQWGDTGNDVVFDAVDAPNGGTFLLGFSYYKVDFGQNPIDLGSQVSSNFVVRLDANQAPVWQKLLSAHPRRAILDSSTLIVGGDAQGSVSYDGSPAAPSAGVFVLRIDRSNGSLLKASGYAGDGSGARLGAMAGDANGNLLLAGYVLPPADFGGGALPRLVGYDPFLFSTVADGTHRWSTLFCSTGPAKALHSVAWVGGAATALVPFLTDLEVGSKSFSGQTQTDTALVVMP